MAYIQSHVASRPRHLARRRTGLVGALLTLGALARQRRQLARMDAAQLHDIGLTPDAARTEARRKPWDVPANWRF